MKDNIKIIDLPFIQRASNADIEIVGEFGWMETVDCFLKWSSMKDQKRKYALKPYIKKRIGEMSGFNLK